MTESQRMPVVAVSATNPDRPAVAAQHNPGAKENTPVTNSQEQPATQPLWWTHDAGTEIRLADIGLDQPNAARVYDFLLGGASNFALDRQAGRVILDAAPSSGMTARANRAFLGRVVRYLVGSGMDQILDLGSGLPTVGNVHTIAHQINPAARVVYVDCDPIAVTHARQLVAGDDRVGVVQADLRDPNTILNDPITRDLINLARPTAILMVSVLHFVDGDLTDLVCEYRESMVPGGVLGISHAVPPDETPEQRIAAQLVTDVYNRTPTPIHLRDRTTILRLFGGLDLLDPGLVPVDRWRPVGADRSAGMFDAGSMLGAVGRLTSKPTRGRTFISGHNLGRHPIPPPLSDDGRSAGRLRGGVMIPGGT